MPMLDATLAFALTMLGLASVATLLVEIFHRLARLRTSGLSNMLIRLFENEIEPWIEKGEVKLEGKLEDLRDAFVQQLLHNPMVRKPGTWQPLRDLEEISGEEFLRRLGKTKVGEQLRQVASDKEQELGQKIDQLALSFEQIGAAASNFFARRAKILSLVAGIALAFIGNINVLRIYDTYLRNPDTVQAIIATQSTRLPEQWQATEQQLAKALVDLENAGRQKQAVQEIQTQIARVNTSLAELSGAGVPLGYEHYPVPSGRQRILWFFGLLLTGILLGLGGPFWFDLVVRINRLRQVLGGTSQKQSSTLQASILPQTADDNGTAHRIALVRGVPYPN